ncbi:MAG: RNA polymerase sigma factor [Anaerolineales bacterium]
MTEDIETLAHQCRTEESRFRLGQDNSTSACRELFRLAIVHQSQRAWRAVHEQYHAQLLRWASGHQAAAEDIAQKAWEKFIHSVTPERFPRFANIGALMSFLKRCVKSVLIDRARAEERVQNAFAAWIDIEGERHQPPSSSYIIDDIVRQQFVEDVYDRLRDEEERLVIFLSFELGLPPRDIAARYPEKFPAPKRVSRIKERVIRRLANDPVLRKRYGE